MGGMVAKHANPELARHWNSRLVAGEAIIGLGLTEPRGGSDAANLQLKARRDNEGYVLDGEKTWISNGGIADLYVVFARTGEAPGARGISAFIVEAGTPGFEIAERIDVIAPHPLARLKFTNCKVPLAHRVGAAGEGFKIAMRTLDVFRTSVAAAALGFARRALDEALQRATTRQMFGQTLADFQLTQAKLAQMARNLAPRQGGADIRLGPDMPIGRQRPRAGGQAARGQRNVGGHADIGGGDPTGDPVVGGVRLGGHDHHVNVGLRRRSDRTASVGDDMDGQQAACRDAQRFLADRAGIGIDEDRGHFASRPRRRAASLNRRSLASACAASV
jgi:hypothetical protein